LFLFGSVCFGSFNGKSLTLGDKDQTNRAPYFFGTFDAAGYSDWIYYGPSPFHEFDYHEILSGEYGAAIYYNGIGTQNQNAMWLTRQFDFPDWITNSDFVMGSICQAWADPNSNPAPLYDTGKSIIHNNHIEVTVDYEVVDLAFRDPNFYISRSPISYIDEQSGQPRFIYSDRYCILQTYTFRALAPVTDFEFYIFSHSHGADEYSGYVNSTYTALAPYDPLEDYTPYNPVHTIGNFCYDLTQWNGPAFGNADHVDFVSVSSTIEPDWFDNDVYRGGHWYEHQNGRFKPDPGTHLNIENRELNGVDRIYGEEVGGAMGWSMDALDPNETTSITLAYMFGPAQEATGLLALSKEIVNPQSCYLPEDEVTFTINWENLSANVIENAVLLDYLPIGVTYPVNHVFDPNTMTFVSTDPNYNDQKHTYRWELGTLDAYESGSKTITVTVNTNAEPAIAMQNKAVLATSAGNISATCTIPVCCWGDGIVYVNPNAAGLNIGTDWANAYTDLQRALTRATSGCVTEIWVSQGSYDPGRSPGHTFTIPADVHVYGGFTGYETSRSQRNPNRNKTILTGSAEAERNETIVTMGDGSLLDGFTITDAAEYGIYGTGADFTIENCIVENSDGYGIYSANGNVAIKRCKIYGSQFDGVYHRGSHYTLTVENSWILRNGEYGIYVLNSTPNIKNSIISESDLSEKGRQGIRIVNPTLSPILHNNTIANNKGAGISFVDNANASNDPNFKDYPDVQNCIVYYNNNGGPQFAGVNPDLVANFCCIQDCNTVNTNNFNDEPGFAYTVDPNGIPDPNNYHLSAGSACVDRGNPDPAMGYASQVDYDNEARQYGDRVDVGADEVYNCDDEYLSQADVYNALDWNADGIVNLVEFNEFSAAWLSHNPKDPLWLANPNLVDPNAAAAWNPMCNLDSTGSSTHTIDTADLTVFLNDWLWVACWKLEEINAAAVQAESMLAQSLSSARSLSVYSLDVSVESAVVQSDVAEVSAETLIQILEFLNSASAEGSNNTAGIEEIKAILLAELQGLQSTETQ